MSMLYLQSQVINWSIDWCDQSIGGQISQTCLTLSSGECKTELSAPFAAARDGDVPALQAHLAAGWDPASLDKHGSTALMWAAGGGHLDVCMCASASELQLRIWAIDDCIDVHVE